MHNSDPSDIHAERPQLGNRVPRRQSPAIPNQTPAELDAVDRAIEENDDGSDSFFESLIQRYSGYMAAAIRRTGNVRQDVIEDAIQNAVWKFLELVRDGSRIENPKAWLAQVARNSAIYLVKKQSNRDRIDKELERSASWTTGSSDLEVVARDIVESLSSEHREIVEMLLAGSKRKEIASDLEVSPITLYRRIEEIKRELGPLLLERDWPKSSRRR